MKGLKNPGQNTGIILNLKRSFAKCPSHRLLAIRRGESEEFLKVSITVSEENAIAALEKIFINGGLKEKK